MKLFRTLLAALAMACVATAAQAGAILIVNGSVGTSEPSTTANITNNLKALHEAVGNVVTIVSDIPANLTGYKQVWDIRFSNNFALTGAQQAQYLGFLQGGGGMFLMGENDGFMSRNTSIFQFVNLVGGGVLGPNLVGGCDGVQKVNAPFTGPNPVSSINWACAGVMGSKGTGQWMTERNNGTGGSGIAWGVGQMANALAGALTMLLDVNFMEGTRGVDMQNFTKNLIGFIGDQVDPPKPVPEPAALALLGFGLLGIAVARRRRPT